MKYQSTKYKNLPCVGHMSKKFWNKEELNELRF